MPLSRSSPSDGYSTGRRHTPVSPNIWRKGQKEHVFGGDSLLFYSRHSHSARVTIPVGRGWRLSTRQPGVQGPASVQAHRTGGVTGSEEREGANGVGGGIRVGGGNGDGNGDVNGHGDEDGAGTGTGVEVNEGAQDGNGDESGDGAGTGTGTGVGTRRRTPDGNGDGSEDGRGDGNGDEDNGNGNEDRIVEGGRETKKRKKPQNSCRRRAGNGGDTGWKDKKM